MDNTLKVTAEEVAEYEISKAFSDRHNIEPYGLQDKARPGLDSDTRNLHFLCTVLLTVKQAAELLEKYVGRCNMFDPVALFHLPRNGMVRVGREYSACIYVTVPQLIHKTIADKLKADEFDLHQSIGLHCHHVYRFWWD
jgi:hypothetical protein